MKIKLEELECVNKNIQISKYIEFRELVKSKMPYPEWLGDFSEEDIKELLKNSSKIWIYFLEETPICSMMLIPADEKSMKKFEIKIDYRKVAEYGPIFVNQNYVGNGLQYQMLKELDNYCKKCGYEYAVSTVHPENIYSINNFIKDDFTYQRTLEFKRGIRNIYLKHVNVKKFYDKFNQ